MTHWRGDVEILQLVRVQKSHFLFDPSSEGNHPQFLGSRYMNEVLLLTGFVLAMSCTGFTHFTFDDALLFNKTHTASFMLALRGKAVLKTRRSGSKCRSSYMGVGLKYCSPHGKNSRIL